MAADLLVVNGRLAAPGSESCVAVAVQGGRVVAIDRDARGARWHEAHTTVIDARGATVLPGFHDAHLHFLMLGLSLAEVDLFEVPSLAMAVGRVAQAAAQRPPGTWLQGRGWLQDLWPEGRFPTAADLDAVTPHHPAVLRHKSEHAIWCNSLALRAAGVDERTPDPPGGRLARDGAGRPTGVLFEAAMAQVTRQIPDATADECQAAVRRAQQLAHARGLTAVQCFDGRASLAAFQSLRARDELRLRVTSHLHRGQVDGAAALGVGSGFGDAWLRLGHQKLFADGALGSLTAAMLAPYEGSTDRGVAMLTGAAAGELIASASRAGIASAVHAIGDAACRDMLDAFAQVRAAEAAAGIAPESRRHRLEHAQLLAPADLGRCAELGVIASMQPIHATQDMDMVDRWWGERGQGAYAFASLLATGARLAFGSDAPVEDVNPLLGLHAAVTRCRTDGRPGPAGWYPAQRLSLTEALAAYTTGAAWSCGREDDLGRLAPGYRADLVVLDRDLTSTAPMELATVQPRYTVVAGEVVHAAE